MSNPYYDRTFNAIPFTLIPSAAHNGQFALIETAFDAAYVDIAAMLAEITAARQGSGALLTRLQRYLDTITGLTGNISANGFRFTALGAPVAGSDAATKAYADGLAMSTALPDDTGNAGLEVTTDGTTPRWGVSAAGSLAILVYLGY